MDVNKNYIKHILDKIHKYNSEYVNNLNEKGKEIKNICEKIPWDDPIKEYLTKYIRSFEEFSKSLRSEEQRQEAISRMNLLDKL